jgi:hypothetical protein
VKVALVLLLTLAGLSAAHGGLDPAQDYLSNFSPLGGDKTIYSSDTLYRLELDLDGDGEYEVMLSMARDQDGKQRNVWTVYANTPAGYTRIGTINFSSRSFYLGPIEDLGDYGLVTFKPGNDGEGMLSAYLFNGVMVREIEIAQVTRDPESGGLRGQTFVDKYMTQATDGVDPLISTNAAALARQFGLKVAETHSSSLSGPSSSRSAASSEPDQSQSPSARTEASGPFPWLLLIAVGALAGIGAVVWVKRR